MREAPGAAAPITVGIVAGETSGDALAATLIAAMRAKLPQVRFAGVAGPKMVAAGCEQWVSTERLAVRGVTEVVRHLPELVSIRRGLVRRFLGERVPLFVGVDAPDFNLGLERRLKARGVRTIHFVSPSVWAWRRGRAAKIGRSADRVLCLFPMEPPIYARHGVDARFVGHPMADAMALEPDRAGARAGRGLAADAPVLAALPGSRRSEIERLLPVFLDALSRIAGSVPGLVTVIPAANAACRTQIEAMLAQRTALPTVHLVDGRAHRKRSIARVARDLADKTAGGPIDQSHRARRAGIGVVGDGARNGVVERHLRRHAEHRDFDRLQTDVVPNRAEACHNQSQSSVRSKKICDVPTFTENSDAADALP